MFGYVIVNKPELKIKDFDIYRSFYCGLCQCLKKEFGQLSRFSLNYDMTFLAILLTALYEPPTEEKMKRCMVHPMQKRRMYDNIYLSYAAEMTIVLTYLKCEDNWQDEHSHTSHMYQKVLKHRYESIKQKYPEKVTRIEKALTALGEEEKKGTKDLDLLASYTGRFMAEILCYKEDEWAPTLKTMGDYLGRYIYLLDAYDDLEEDKKKQCFNPLLEEAKKSDFDERMRTILELMISASCEAFEILPVIAYADIIRNVLYTGIWAKYELARKKRTGEEDGRSL